jgi:hypothetical protein
MDLASIMNSKSKTQQLPFKIPSNQASILHTPREWADDDSGDEYFSGSDAERLSDVDEGQVSRYYFISKMHLRSVQAMEITQSSADLSYMEMDVSWPLDLMCALSTRVP